MRAEVGDIILCDFPSHDGSAMKKHFCIVLEVTKTHLYVAYGTSKKVDVNCPRETEVVISDDEDLKACGLPACTKGRFDLALRANVSKRTCRVSGSLPRTKYPALFKAAKAAHIA